MHCILNAQTPYFNTSMRDDKDDETVEQLRNRISEVKKMANINEELYDYELVNHEFLSDDYRIQRTTFKKGNKTAYITVDFDKDSYKIEKSAAIHGADGPNKS